MSLTSFVAATQTRSILGPLTTTYSAPEVCFNYGQATLSPTAWQAQGCSTGNLVDTSSCWPAALVSAPPPPLLGWGFYSPGLICPTGYTTACTAALDSVGDVSTITAGTSFSFQFGLLPGETAIGCCPTGFTCGPSGRHVAQTCMSIMTTGSILAGFCENPGLTLTDFQYVNVPATNTINAASSTFSEATLTTALVSMTLFAPLFQLNFQASDLANAAAATNPADAGAQAGGLSTGAKIALGVGIPMGIIAIAGIVACLWLRRRRQNRNLTGRVISPPRVVPTAAIPRQPAAHMSYYRGSELDSTGQYQGTGMPVALSYDRSAHKSFHSGSELYSTPHWKETISPLNEKSRYDAALPPRPLELE